MVGQNPTDGHAVSAEGIGHVAGLIDGHACPPILGGQIGPPTLGGQMGPPKLGGHHGPGKLGGHSCLIRVGHCRIITLGGHIGPPMLGGQNGLERVGHCRICRLGTHCGAPTVTWQMCVKLGGIGAAASAACPAEKHFGPWRVAVGNLASSPPPASNPPCWNIPGSKPGLITMVGSNTVGQNPNVGHTNCAEAIGHRAGVRVGSGHICHVSDGGHMNVRVGSGQIQVRGKHPGIETGCRQSGCCVWGIGKHPDAVTGPIHPGIDGGASVPPPAI